MIGRRDIEALCGWWAVYFPPAIGYDNGYDSSKSYPVFVQRAMLSSTELCYCPQSYVIVHMLSSTDLCYRPWGYVIFQWASLGLCYRPQSYVIVHRAML